MIKEITENDITIFVVYGEITPQVIIDYMKARYSEDKPINKNVIWNIDKGNLKERQREEIQDLTNFLESFDKLKTRSGGCTAYVASNDNTFGLLRMYHAYIESIENLPVTVGVFRTNEEAKKWFSTDCNGIHGLGGGGRKANAVL